MAWVGHSSRMNARGVFILAFWIWTQSIEFHFNFIHVHIPLFLPGSKTKMMIRWWWWWCWSVMVGLKCFICRSRNICTPVNFGCHGLLPSMLMGSWWWSNDIWPQAKASPGHSSSGTVLSSVKNDHLYHGIHLGDGWNVICHLTMLLAFLTYYIVLHYT